MSPMFRIAALSAAALAAAACTSVPPETVGPAAAETLYAVTANQHLIRFNGGQPQKLLSDRPLTGLAQGERVLGIDYRVARGQMYALGSTGQLYRVDPATAALTPVGTRPAQPPAGAQFGFDFNPTVDRIRVVSDAGLNMRLHPDTGAIVDSDPNTAGLQLDGRLAYDAADRNAGREPKIAAAGYSYNQQDEKITTNYAIDAGLGVLVRQGSLEGTQPVVSPNTGRLFTIGTLGAGPIGDVHFDISDVRNQAYAAISAPGAKATVLYRVDLQTGAATRIGTVAGGAALAGLAIEP